MCNKQYILNYPRYNVFVCDNCCNMIGLVAYVFPKCVAIFHARGVHPLFGYVLCFNGGLCLLSHTHITIKQNQKK